MSAGLPQMSDSEIMRLLLSEDESRSQEESEVAASIGEQMLHMDLPIMARSVRARIRDICSRVSPSNAVLVGGGIGHLSAWLFDLWCTSEEDNCPPISRPSSFRIIEPGTRFRVIIERLIRRYEADSWAEVISMEWQEAIAESTSALASNISLPEGALQSPLTLPINLVVVDLPEESRVEAVTSAFEIVSPGGLVISLEPTVPTGDVGEIDEEEGPNPAQKKVQSFNEWIDLIKRVNENHSVGFAELTGGSIVGLLKGDSTNH